MMLNRIFIVLLLTIAGMAHAQKQANVWYFGDHAGVDFNGGNPVGITGGQTYLQSAEGTAVICDSSGSMLFYTNGEKILNRLHQVMHNGDSLLGHYSSTQSSLILPVPGTNELFYVFTTDSWYLNDLRNGFRYSIVDICQDNGLGAVLEGQKNILVLDTVSEKLTAVRHANGIDYWVVVHKYFSDAFHSYLFTANGMVDSVITHIGSIHDHLGQTAAAIGYMKASPNGRKLALASINGGNLREVFDFDPLTGTLSNYLNLQISNDSFAGGYGLSFSPDNSKLYIEANIGHTYQYNLLAGGGDPDSVRGSKYKLNLQGTYSSAIQLGPDHKLYTGAIGTPYLSLIEFPDSLGAACGFRPNAIQLQGGVCGMGLPNIVDSYSYSNGMPSCPVKVLDGAEEEASLVIHPNPVSAEARVELPKNVTCSVEVLDAAGRLVWVDEEAAGGVHVDCRAWPSGMYFLRAIGDGRVFSGRFTKL